MTRLHSNQRSFSVAQHAVVVTPYQDLVNAPVSPLASRPSVLIPAPAATPENQHLVISGEVITSRTTFPGRTISATKSKQGLLRRTLDDPYWILMTLAITLIGSITATVIYGIIQITFAIGHWLTTNGTTLGTIAALAIIVMLCGGTTAAKCAGIHCGGCRR
ncbi:MAG: hypothetical protein M3319_08590 [Actinomycetota bacterium]|nr:hypothetical protein [Actinomycetota bacterium]